MIIKVISLRYCIITFKSKQNMKENFKENAITEREADKIIISNC